MKFLIVFCALFAYALARPGNVEILKQESEVLPDSYKFVVETSDGKFHEEEGFIKDADSERAAIVVHGTFRWKDEKDGQVYTVTYIADENGFQPFGAHLPRIPSESH